VKKADIPQLRTLRPEPRRNWDAKGMLEGGYVLPHPQTGQADTWCRATNLAGLHEDHRSLDKWKLRTALEGMTYLDGALDQVTTLVEKIDTADDWRQAATAKKALDRLAAAAMKAAGGSDGSDWGTLLHTITEWSDAGRLDEVLPEIESWGDTGTMLLARLDNYTQTMTDNGLVCPPEYIERICVNTTVRTGGTLDRMVLLPAGRLWIGDLKTQKSMGFGAVLKIAAQLAEYAFADGLLAVDGASITPMPADLEQTHALIMWLPVFGDTCTLIELGPEEMELGWSLAQHAAQTLWYREIADQVRGRPYDPARITTPAAVLSEISHAESVDHLTSIWNRTESRRVWTDEHTAAAKARKAELRKVAA
jgi:hypothetical protein